jgi:hypothetical protein
VRLKDRPLAQRLSQIHGGGPPRADGGAHLVNRVRVRDDDDDDRVGRLDGLRAVISAARLASRARGAGEGDGQLPAS